MHGRRIWMFGLAATIAVSRVPLWAQPPASPLGVFESATDVGEVRIPGEARFHPESGIYRVTGSGENMWFTTDAFHFVWKKVSGDVRLSADVQFLGAGRNAHRKAVLMFRQGLDADAAYVDLAIHGDGLTSMQFRGDAGASTHELQLGKPAPRRAEIVREGNLISVRIDGEEMKLAGRPVRMENFFRGEMYAGIGVCSHEESAVETAIFSHVELKTANAQTGN